MAALNPGDLMDIGSLLSDEEGLVRDTVARFVSDKVLPIIRECFEEHRFPVELVPEMARLGLFGLTLEGYGCAGLNNTCQGLICQELERSGTTFARRWKSRATAATCLAPAASVSNSPPFAIC